MAEPETTPQKTHNVGVDYDDLHDILLELDGKKRAVSEAAGTLRSRLKEILEDRDWNKGGLQTIRSIHEMSETKRADFLRTFDALYRVMMEEAWSAEMKDMLDDLDGDGDAD